LTKTKDTDNNHDEMESMEMEVIECVLAGIAWYNEDNKMNGRNDNKENIYNDSDIYEASTTDFT
jgi:hypothetical protein